MNDYLSPHVLIIALTFFLAGIVKGVTGMRLPTVAMGILGAITSPVSAASLLVIPSFVTNFWQLFRGPDFLALMKRLWLMMLGIVVGTLAGSWLLTSANTEDARVGLGSALVRYAVQSLWAKPLSVTARLERLLSPVIGLTTGAITGGTGVFVIPAVPISKPSAFPKMTLSRHWDCRSRSKRLRLRRAWLVAELSILEILLCPHSRSFPRCWACGCGTTVRERISAATFRRWFLISLAILGLELVVRSFFL